MTPIDESKRRQDILKAAMTAFSQYGYARTKMEDIASASGVARTALYKLFSNKEHIFRALAETVQAGALAKAEQAFQSDKVFPERLEAALLARDTHLLELGHSGPHADEIAELYLSLAGDLAEASNKALVDLLAKETKAAIKQGAFALPPAYRSASDFAYLLRLALEGIKREVKSVDAFRKLARQMIRAMNG